MARHNYIPKRCKTYAENTGGSYVQIKTGRPWRYKYGGKGTTIDVVGWERWPSYDFIFGIPAKTNPRYKTEAGFFQYRDTRNKHVVCGFYVDMNELRRLKGGIDKILRAAKKLKQ